MIPPLELKLACSYKFPIFICPDISILCVYYAPLLFHSQFIYNPLKRQTFGSKSNENIERTVGPNRDVLT